MPARVSIHAYLVIRTLQRNVYLLGGLCPRGRRLLYLTISPSTGLHGANATGTARRITITGMQTKALRDQLTPHKLLLRWAPSKPRHRSLSLRPWRPRSQTRGQSNVDKARTRSSLSRRLSVEDREQWCRKPGHEGSPRSRLPGFRALKHTIGQQARKVRSDHLCRGL